MKVARQRSSFVLSNHRRKLFLISIFVFPSAIFLHLNSGYESYPLAVLTKYEENQLRGYLPIKFPNATTDDDSATNQQHQFETKNKDTTHKPVIWSRARSDRSGAAIQDMLMCHAFAYNNDLEYGGACDRNIVNIEKINENKPNHQLLLDSVGLSKVLQFRCPEDAATPLRNRDDYIRNDTGIFTLQYLKYLQSLIDYPPKPEQLLVSVHIRRGDISPCRPRTRGYPRYLPNQHFLRLIDRYNPHNRSKVVVYSESESFESFDEFLKRGFEVILDGSIGDVWRGILVSDVIILSRSSFSLVPAIMAKGKVVFTPFWHLPLPHWDVVEEEFVNETLTEFRRLKSTCPKKKK